MSTLDQILPPAEALAHPLTGEVIERDDVEAIKAALSETREYIYRPEVRKMYAARDALEARLGELVPTELPKPGYQTRYQKALRQCPKCSTKLPQTFIVDESESEQIERLAEGALAEGEGSAVPPSSASASSEAVPSPDPGEGGSPESPPTPVDDALVQTTLLPEGQRTKEQEEALGIDIFGESTETPNKIGDVTNPPSSVVGGPPADDPETGAVSREDAAPASPQFPEDIDPVVKEAGSQVFSGGKYAGWMVAAVGEIDPDYLVYAQNVSTNERLVAAITTWLAAKPSPKEV